MPQQTMYPGQVNSPQTELNGAITISATSITVLNGAQLPAAPNLAVIGSGETAETILYSGKSGNDLTSVTRGFQGTAKAWGSGIKVARFFTAYDYDTLKGNITDHESRIVALLTDYTNSLNARNGMNANALINGNFDVWQRGTTSVLNDFIADRWQIGLAGDTSITQSQQAFTVGQTDVPNNPKYFHRTIVVAGSLTASNALLRQRIKSVRTFSGQTVTLSFSAKADASKSIAIEFSQVFGTGGSTTVNTVGVNKVALTTTWQKFELTVSIPSISGKIIGTANDYLQINIFFEAGSDFNSRTDSLGNQSGTFDIAQVQLCAGDTALPYQPRSFTEELALCQRYYFRIENDQTSSRVGLGFANSATLGFIFLSFPVEMRTIPTLVVSAATDLFLSDTTLATALTAISLHTMTVDTATLSCGVASGLTAFRPYFLEFGGAGSKFIAFDSEL